MKKLFVMLAMVLAIAACNKMQETEVLSVSQENEDITIIATLPPKTPVAKAVADNGDNKITVTWAQNEKIAILYEANSVKKVAVANIDSVDGETGAATITFSVAGGTADDTPCTLVYPASAAKEDNSGVKAYDDFLSTQDGTLNANLDVRVGEGTIQITTPALTVTTQPAAQFAIFRFTLKKSDESNLPVTSLVLSAGTASTMIAPATATNVLYAAIPAVSSQEFGFIASGNDNKTYAWSKASVSFNEGYFYQSTLKLSEQTLPGSGTSGDPYLIASKADWDALAAIVNGGTGNVHARQVAPINGITTVIGTESKPFKGVYNGQGYRISDISLSGESSVGLFGCVDGASAVIENVVVSSGSVTVTNTRGGGIVGKLLTGTVQYCANYANVTHSSSSNDARSAGIVGHMDSSGDNKVVQYCINFGNVTGYSYVGGIVGSFGEGTVSHCQNYGSITTNSNSSRVCGGVIGYKSSSGTSLTYNHNGGNVSLPYYYTGSGYLIMGSSGDVSSSNTYWTSMTLRLQSNVYTGASQLSSNANGATAVSTNPTGIPIGGHYYAGPGAPAL